MEELASLVQSNSFKQKEVFKGKYKVINIEPVESSYISFKQVLDYAITLLVVIPLLPLFAFVAVLIKLDSKGDVFFRQIRYGKSGKPFTILKFRTMVDGAHHLQHKLSHLNEMQGGKLFKSDNDPRITNLGKFLRKTSIDELPQLFNILKSEMSIIGPRPLSTPLDEYDEEDLVRFKVKPGLGCIWQAYFRKETDFKTWMKTDSIYVTSISAKLDLKLFITILKNVLITKGAR